MEATPEMIAMAWSIADTMDFSSMRKIDWQVAHDAALAAIIETTELAARMIDDAQPQFTSGLSMLIPRLEGNRDGLPYAAALRSADHLKGPDNAQ